jgi:hypothetical protein
MKTLKTIHNERGFVLLVVYFIVIFVTIFSVVLFARHRSAILATERYQNRILAFNAAESGIDHALNALAADEDYAGESFTPLTPVNDAVRCGFSVTVETTAQYNQRHLAHPELYPDFDAIPEDPSNLIRIIEAKGFSPDNNPVSRGYQTSSVVVYCQLTTSLTPSSLFTHGVYAENSISLSGNSAFDSYNSISGAYGGSNKSSAGEMAVNSTQAGSISLTGNSKINGNVYVGYTGTPNTVISTTQNATITGTRSNLSQTWVPPDPVEVPDGATSITISVSGNNTLTLAPGTYHAASLKVSGNGKIKTTGAVKIYVDGAIDITGNGIAVPNNRPENLLLYSTGSAAVKIAGNGSFYGGVFAPNSAVTANGNGDVFGAVVAKTYTQEGNSATHFDLSLKGIAGPPTEGPKTVHITAWQELNSLAWGTGA